MDRILKYIHKDGEFLLTVAETTQLVENARRIHNLSPTANAALGRTLTASAILGSSLKNETDSITIQIKGDGPIGGIIVVSNFKSQVRGYVNNPQVWIELNEQNKLNVKEALGKGYINIIKDLGLKEPYIGMVPLMYGEIAEDLTYYFAKSEQIPSSVSLGVLINKECTTVEAGGMILQMLPGARESTIEKLEKNILELSSFTTLLRDGKTLEEIAMLVGNSFDLENILTVEPEFKCNCNKDRFKSSLITLGKKELDDIARSNEKTELVCHFCNKKYIFTRQEIENLKDSI